MGVVAQPAPTASDTPAMNLAPANNPVPGLLASTAPMPIYGGEKSTPLFGVANTTAKRAAWAGAEPSRMRRVLVAGSAAALVAAVALTIALWPGKDQGASSTTASTTATTTTTTTTTTTPPPSGAKATFATLQISVDAPANIAVDGEAQPMGESATVNVQPGVEHVVTVQRPGHSVRKLHVPALAPGEHMPLKFTVR